MMKNLMELNKKKSPSFSFITYYHDFPWRVSDKKRFGEKSSFSHHLQILNHKTSILSILWDNRTLISIYLFVCIRFAYQCEKLSFRSYLCHIFFIINKQIHYYSLLRPVVPILRSAEQLYDFRDKKNGGHFFSVRKSS